MTLSAEAAWVAGFLEGEGSFTVQVTRKSYGTYYYARVSASQKDREVLDRLRDMVGGSVRRSGPCFHWSLFGVRADALARLIAPQMSTRRRVQIDEMLDGVTRRREIELSTR